MASRRKGQMQQAQTEQEEAPGYTLKYPSPRILLIDVQGDVETVLKAEGYNICTGSFGTPYQVPTGDGFVPVVINGWLPNDYAEQDVVAIDLKVAGILAGQLGQKDTSPGELDWWASCSHGVIDPRPRQMVTALSDLDRILAHGGAFVVLAEPRIRRQTCLGYTKPYLNEIIKEADISADNWSFLSILRDLEAKASQGREISIAKGLVDSSLDRCLSDQGGDCRFTCTVRPRPGTELEKRWYGWATNRYGDTVAGILCAEDIEIAVERRGWVFVAPQVQDKARFLSRMLGEVLPDFAPHLFPHMEGLRWAQRPEYELPEINSLNQQIYGIREEATRRIASLEEQIANVRAEKGYLHDLLRESGRPLVLAVKRVLENLGFRNVIDVDAEEAGNAGPRREDLRVDDPSPVLLVEVKGTSLLPKDADVLQVWKYLTPRMREWERTDVRGLSIVNHQRHVPALERENTAPFRNDLLTNAETHEFGLLTTWDLYRLMRSFTSNNWNPENVKPLFYRNGRIEPVPTHYEFVGRVQHFWPDAGAVGVEVEGASLSVGDRIAFELQVEFVEQEVDSLQVDRQAVAHVSSGQRAGIATHLTAEEARKGVRVFRVGD